MCFRIIYKKYTKPNFASLHIDKKAINIIQVITEKISMSNMKKAIYTLLNIIEFFLACYGAGYLIDKYTNFEDSMRLGMFVCIVVWCIAFYYYHVKDKPEEKEHEPLSLLQDAVRETSLKHAISQATSHHKDAKGKK